MSGNDPARKYTRAVGEFTGNFRIFWRVPGLYLCDVMDPITDPSTDTSMEATNIGDVVMH